MKGKLLAVFMTVLTISSVGTAAAAPGLNYSDDRSPDPTAVEDQLIISEHDRGEMSALTDYYDDNGEVAELPATVNQSQDTPAGVRFDQIDAEAHYLFPRIDGETDNAATWTDASEWTTSSGSNSGVTVSDADADGVQKVNYDGSIATGEQATSTFANNVSITTDADKRVMFAVVNVNELTSGAAVEVRAVDSDGDYRYAEINGSANAADSDVIANSTGNGYVFQSKLNSLPLAGSGDGSMDEIQSVEIVQIESNSDVTLAGFDLDKKSTVDLAEIERDTDGDGELEQTTATNLYEGGVTNVTGLDTLGSAYDDAVLNDLHVYDVEYRMSDLVDSEEYSTNFSSADDYTYPQKLELYADLEVPSAIDLSHGTLTLEFEQGLVNERYVVAEIAEGADTTEEFGNLSDSAYSSWTGSLGSKGSTATVDSSVSADTNYRVHMIVLLQDDEVDALQATGAIGPTGSSGGGFFSTLFGQITGLVTVAAGAIGLRRVFGSG